MKTTPEIEVVFSKFSPQLVRKNFLKLRDFLFHVIRTIRHVLPLPQIFFPPGFKGFFHFSFSKISLFLFGGMGGNRITNKHSNPALLFSALCLPQKKKTSFYSGYGVFGEALFLLPHFGRSFHSLSGGNSPPPFFCLASRGVMPTHICLIHGIGTPWLFLQT